MHRIRRVSRALIIAVFGMAGVSVCESQDQREKVVALAREVDRLQQENSGLKQQAEGLTKENQDLRAQLEAATKKPAPAKK
ncbi:MAG: hypothetical protein HY713_08400 [candidate division NC10 bacterium]|nr:hypothetical protein [candidate division NC10 bacterium]